MGREAEHRRAEALDRYWDAIVAGDAIVNAPELGESRVQLIHRLQALDEAPGREAAQRRVWEHLSEQMRRDRKEPAMTTLRMDAIMPGVGPVMGRNGRIDAALPGRDSRARHRWILPP